MTPKDVNKPTRENSTPLGINEEAWMRGDGRGSIVWFNQATMFQTSELGFETIKQAKVAGVQVDTSGDWMDRGIFPTKK